VSTCFLFAYFIVAPESMLTVGVGFLCKKETIGCVSSCSERVVTEVFCKFLLAITGRDILSASVSFLYGYGR
jgi:hypothetical protein